MDEEKLNRKIRNYICHHIGTSIYISSLRYKSGTNKVNVILGYSIPRVIYDDAMEKQYIKFVKLNNVAELVFKIDKSGQLITDYDLKYIYETIHKKKYRLHRKVEKLILDEIYPKLFDIPLLQNKFRPIYKILNHIWISNKFKVEDLNSYKEKDKLIKYFDFLENLDMIRRDKNNNYVWGNIPTELRKQIENENSQLEILKKLFGYSLKEGRKYLREELNLPMVDVYIEIVSAYYYLSSQINKTISLSPETFYEEFISVYPQTRVNKTNFFGYLTDLLEAKIVTKKDNLFEGDEKILKSFMEQKKDNRSIIA